MNDSQVFAQRILPYLNAAGRIWVGFSGGLDSTVLLHWVAKLNTSQELAKPLTALHVNHQISPNANHWQEHCEQFARRLGLPCVAERVQVNPHGKGLEDAAREARYAAFAQHLQPGDLLLLAQHRDDLAETLLFRLLRGTGIKGLAATPPSRRFAGGLLLRPLLDSSRQDIEDYARQHRLAFIEDESNHNTDYARNFLRHEILPRLASRWPNYAQSFCQTSAWAAEANALLDEYAQADLLACEPRPERCGNSIALTKLKQFSRQRIKHLIRHWIAQASFSLPHAAQLEQVFALIEAREDAEPLLQWGDALSGGTLRRYQQRLYLSAQLPPTQHYLLDWDGRAPLTLPDGSILSRDQGFAESGHYTLSPRRGGERCQPRERAASQTLKKLLQEYQLEPWLRDRIPLIHREGQLLAVGDLFLCRTERAPEQDLPGLHWRYPATSRARGN